MSDPRSPKLLGKGAFGIVYEGLWNGKIVAIKRIDKTNFLDFSDSAANSTSAGQQREEEVMQQLDHPNVLKLFHVENDVNFRYHPSKLKKKELLKTDNVIVMYKVFLSRVVRSHN